MSDKDSGATKQVACPHPEAVGKRWGDPISEERQGELLEMLTVWGAHGAEHGERKGPFDGGPGKPGVKLTGADVFWLAARALAGSPEAGAVFAATAKLHAAAQDFDLRLSLNLSALNLAGADLYRQHLEGAILRGAHLEGTVFYRAHLEDADLGEALLRRAENRGAENTLYRAHLERANLWRARLEGLDLGRVHLEGATLIEAHLEGTDLRGAFFDTATTIDKTVISDRNHGLPRVADVRWGGVNLATFDTPPRPPLGDERAARKWKPTPLKPKLGQPKPTRVEQRKRRHEQHAERLGLYRDAVRANRQFAVALQDQGMSEEAARFAYQAQMLQRRVYRLEGWRSWGRAFFSGFLDLLAGYGYKPLRAVGFYLLTVTSFALAYFFLGAPPSHQTADYHLSLLEAFVVSLTAFHGRGFFAQQYSPGDPQSILAALEAVIGLLIEISFIATFTQRFFGAK